MYIRNRLQAIVLVTAFLCAGPCAKTGLCAMSDEAVTQANAALRSKMKSEFVALQKEQLTHFSQAREERLKGLELALGALEEDSARMESLSKKLSQANDFLKGLIQKRITVVKELGAAPGEPSAEAVALHERALEMVSEDRLKEAAALYEEIVLRDPEDDEAYLIMGHVYLMSGQYAKAEDAFRNAAHIDPENLRNITPFYENRVLDDPNDDAAYVDLGYARIIVGDALKAKQAFRDALSINPANEAAVKGLELLEKLGA